LKNAFVLLPMAVLIGDQLHPETGLSYQSHWERFDKSKQFLKEIDF
jgi:2-amino-4-hydroxy-6-hydroxymethyldihydropteridine diphosphokinase